MYNASKRKDSGTRHSRKSSPKNEKKQEVLFGSGVRFTEKTLYEKFKGWKLLLDRSINDKKGTLNELEENMFHYSIASVVPSLKENSHPQFWCKYEDVVIDEGVDA